MNIIGKSQVTAEQMAEYLISKNPDAKSWALKYAKIYLEEGEIEGVRGDGAWIQSCKETGNFKFTGGTAVTFDQNNFCGLGVTKKGVKGNVFDTPRLGIRAQIQHLKGYATSEPLVHDCVDPRYKYIKPLGKAPRFEDLAGKWAVPGYDTSKASSLEDAMKKGIGYGFDIIAGIETMRKIKVNKEETTMSYKIAIDAGHGSNTSGKRTPDGYREHWINVKCANYFDIAMKRCGFQTVKVAWDDTNATNDTDVTLANRQKQIKAAGCDASFSWHANAHGSGSTFTTARGIETLIHNYSARVGDSEKLANCVHKYLIKGTSQLNRGVKKQNLAMCNCATMGTKASILLEIGFMTNEYEAGLMKTDAFCLECAEEAAQGACEYFGVKYVKPGTSSNATTTTVSVPLKVTSNKKEIQKFLNKYYGDEIKKVLGALLTVDGAIGNNSKRALGIAFQVELNKLGAKLTVDGKIGSASEKAFDKYVGTLKKGSKGIFVTLWQCVIVGHGYNPKGIDGDFGSGCVSATNTLFGKIGLTKDSAVSGADLNALL